MAWESNKNNILGSIREAREKGAQLVLCPEMSVCGYGCEDVFLAPWMHEKCWNLVEEITKDTAGMIVVVGLPLPIEDRIYNVAAVLVNGKLEGFAAKRYLAREGVHYEPRWFMPWPLGDCEQITRNGKNYPIGDYVFNVGGVGIGFEICEDAWVHERPGKQFADEGAVILLNPSASHFAFTKFRRRQSLVLEASQKFKVGYLYANQLGNEAGRILYDGGGIVAQGGKILAHGKRFSYKDRVVTVADLDVATSTLPESSQLKIDFKWHEPKNSLPAFDEDPWERGPSIKEEEFTRSVAMGFFDYLRKSSGKGYTVSLSGGADSAAATVLLDAMRKIGIDELGEKEFWKRLTKKESGKPADILACVYQKTKNSSETTLASAETVAKAVGADWHVFDIQPIVDSYIDMVSESVGRKLDWDKDDLALQNIQARTRAPGIWLFANLKQHVLLCTMNRSEASAGYATMDGDAAGGLAPIAGIDKHFLRHWLRWVENEGPHGLSTMPALSKVNTLEPTAELRPQEAHQTDESDLMPYVVLDAVERLAIHQRLEPVEVWKRCLQLFPKEADKDLGRWVEKFFTMWSRSQWKRERFAPSFHLDDANVDPRSWCRFPILNGGFESELKELRVALQ